MPNEVNKILDNSISKAGITEEYPLIIKNMNVNAARTAFNNNIL